MAGSTKLLPYDKLRTNRQIAWVGASRPER
jgi:hypothetical protein